MMSRFLIVLLSTFFSFSTLAQDVSKSDQGKIEQRLQEYTNITNENNWDELMEYIYPGLFDIASKMV